MSERKIYIAVIIVLSGILVWMLTHKQLATSQNNFHELEEKYPLLSKRILTEYPNDILINFLPLRKQTRDEVAPYEDSFAMYFEYLPTGTSIGINEKAEFSAVSLFKIPVIMAYYRKKERLDLKDDPVVTVRENQLNKEFGSLWQKGAGAQVSIDEAVHRAIIDSDNTAIQLVADQVQQEDFDYVYEGLDIDLKLQEDTAIITAKHFSSILKALFFSSILTHQHSQYILDLMTKTKFRDKLPAGVPENIPVAHKIGVLRKDMYMDCGIVYVPRRPYSLCMISVSNENVARERMKKISKTVFDYISSVSTRP